MKNNNELEEKDIVVNAELLIDDDNENVVNAYLETWFDVDKKFNIDTASDDDKWANMYADYNTQTDELIITIEISNSTTTEEIAYTPTENEKKLIIRMMEETCQEYYGCNLREFCLDEMDEPMSMGGMA